MKLLTSLLQLTSPPTHQLTSLLQLASRPPKTPERNKTIERVISMMAPIADNDGKQWQTMANNDKRWQTMANNG